MVFGMQRANGDWFAVDKGGNDCVPVFASSAEAMTARSRNPQMECFRAVEIGEEALQVLTHEKPHFWLIVDPLLKLSRGRSIDGVQLAGMVRNDEAIARS